MLLYVANCQVYPISTIPYFLRLLSSLLIPLLIAGLKFFELELIMILYDYLLTRTTFVLVFLDYSSLSGFISEKRDEFTIYFVLSDLCLGLSASICSMGSLSCGSLIVYRVVFSGSSIDDSIAISFVLCPGSNLSSWSTVVSLSDCMRSLSFFGESRYPLDDSSLEYCCSPCFFKASVKSASRSELLMSELCPMCWLTLCLTLPWLLAFWKTMDLAAFTLEL